MDKMYNPRDWYWVVGDDTSRYWSSAACTYVTETPTAFTRIASEDELRNVLASAGCSDLAPSYVPPGVPLWKAREQIRRAGYFETVDGAIQQLGGAALSAWEYAPEMQRNSDLMDNFALMLGLAAEQIDALFVAADAIGV